MFRREADWNVIAEIKQAVKIKVIGNGDIFTAQDAAETFHRTGCDAVMAARGAQGNPFLFTQIPAKLLSEGKGKDISDGSRTNCHVPAAGAHRRTRKRRSACHQTDARACGALREGNEEARPGLRAEVVHAESYAQLEEILNG